MKNFKAIRQIKVTHERGTELLTNVCGKVIKIEKSKVYLKGMFYDFSISKADFDKFNVCTK